MLSQWITATGALLFLILGALHFRLTVADMKAPKHFVPEKRELLEEMKATRIAMRKDVKNFWLSYLGFHLSHSIGVIFYALAVLYCALARPDILYDMHVRLALVVVGAAYVLIARTFWFVIPLAVSGLGVSLIAVGMALGYS